MHIRNLLVGGQKAADVSEAKAMLRHGFDPEVGGKIGMRAHLRHHWREAGPVKTGPVERLLQRLVGQPWNAAYSELVKAIGRGEGSHRVYDAMEHMVAIRCFMEDGEVMTMTYRGPCALAGIRIPFYVHPESGVLMRREVKTHTPAPKAPERRKPGTTIENIGGIWFRVTYAEVPLVFGRPFSAPDIKDAQLGPLGGGDYAVARVYRAYGLAPDGKYIYMASKRQLAHRELVKLGLATD